MRDSRGQANRATPRDRRGNGINFLVLAGVVGVILAVALLLDARGRFEVLRLAVAAILSALPGFLYVRFIEFRGPSIWNEYVFNLARLGIDDPENLPVTLHDYDSLDPDARRQRDRNIYTQKFDAHYGRQNRVRWQEGEQAPSEERTFLKRLDPFVPVILATVAVTIGWAVIVSPPYFGSDGTPALLDKLRFGFLGSYVFITQFLLRRYFQNDLKGTAYFTAIERLVIVPIIILVLHAVVPSPDSWNLGLAFVVGMFPLVGFRTINSVVSSALRHTLPSLETSYPLSDLDGMTIWYEARLLEEGIEDMQSLVTSNPVDVMLETRIPVGRLVDWLDQAHLYLHMQPLQRAGVWPTRAHKEREKQQQCSDRLRLRRFGIRAATDLEDAFTDYGADAFGEQCATAEERQQYFAGLKTLLADDDGPSVTLTILRSLQREPTLALVRNWKNCTVPRRPTAGHGRSLPVPPSAVENTADARTQVYT